MQSTEPTKRDKLRPVGSPAQSMEWLPTVLLSASKLDDFSLLLVVIWLNGQWTYYAEHQTLQIAWQTKTRHNEWKAVPKPAEVRGFSCAESGTEVHAERLPEFLLWKSL